jgi:hypothetical protein
MQISIEQHNEVVTGLAAELEIRNSRIAALDGDLEAARKLIHVMDKAGQEMGDQLVAQHKQHADQLSLITATALGYFQERCDSEDPAWTPALANTEDLLINFRKKVGELEMVLAAKASKRSRK